jgi:hypothetical protein
VKLRQSRRPAQGAGNQQSRQPSSRPRAPHPACSAQARGRKGLGSRPRGLQGPRAYRGLFCGSRCGLARTFLTGQVRGRADSSVIPRCDVFGSRRWGHDNPGRSSLLGGRGVGLRCDSWAGNSVRRHLWTRRIFCPSFARHKLQPRRAAIVFNVTRVATNLLLARPLGAGGLESRGHGFPGSDSGRRLGSRINRKG